MKIQLSQDEIAQAVRDYVSQGVTLQNGAQMAVDFSMGRGENGLSATIDVPYMGVSAINALQPAVAVASPRIATAMPAPPGPAFRAQATALSTAPAPAETPVLVNAAATDASPLGEDTSTASQDPTPAPVTGDAPAVAATGKSLFQSPAASQ